MDWNLFAVSLWITLIGICLYLIVIIFGIILTLFCSKNKEVAYNFFRNMNIGIFGGIAAAIILELNGSEISLAFFITKLPLALLLIMVFSGFGLFYMIIIEKIYKGEFFPNLFKINKVKK